MNESILAPNRRSFLKTAGLLSLGLLAQPAGLTAWGAPAKAAVPIRGVNLGGWLVLEKWIKPTLFTGLKAEDEYSFCQELGTAAAARLQHHRETWITDEDFAWLAAHGINSVRLPVGYWVAEENPPFVSGLETMTQAFKSAKRHGLSVLLDLHGAPGSQNGWDHSGRQGSLGWHTSPENISHTIKVLENLAAWCRDQDNLLGIELINEPKDEIPQAVLQDFYRRGYEAIRKQLPADRAAVVFHDSFRPLIWDKCLSGAAHANVLLDTHLYQCFSPEDNRRDINEQLVAAGSGRTEQLLKMQAHHACIVGEWSLGLPPKTMEGLTAFTCDEAMRAYAATQLLSYERTRGWYFWTYRTEEKGGWNFRAGVERGWFPAHFAPPAEKA
ncbi:MAG TPA: glycoside hydrolase family 5 protein [Verrucomicrobiae bacterium]